MPRLNELTTVFRSKNAGPFQITVDLMFDDRAILERVLRSPSFCVAEIARLYALREGDVAIVPFEEALAIKVTFPRTSGERGAGSRGDRDVYGAQQHAPLLDMRIA